MVKEGGSQKLTKYITEKWLKKIISPSCTLYHLKHNDTLEARIYMVYG